MSLTLPFAIEFPRFREESRRQGRHHVRDSGLCVPAGGDKIFENHPACRSFSEHHSTSPSRRARTTEEEN